MRGHGAPIMGIAAGATAGQPQTTDLLGFGH
jgi:hypothetical protein